MHRHQVIGLANRGIAFREEVELFHILEEHLLTGVCSVSYLCEIVSRTRSSRDRVPGGH